MYKIYHNLDFVATVETKDEVYEVMFDYIRNVLKFKSYYIRWVEVSDKVFWVDYGSHTNFFNVSLID